jgi:hypothetical protein
MHSYQLSVISHQFCFQLRPSLLAVEVSTAVRVNG